MRLVYAIGDDGAADEAGVLKNRANVGADVAAEKWDVGRHGRSGGESLHRYGRLSFIL